ncbi:MAG TPA: hypothetical protein VEX13_00585 [Chloroflexia bacterium]|nr:hypothetical protein [Chloroflexia bacterium]
MPENRSKFPVGDLYNDLSHQQDRISSGVMRLMMLVMMVVGYLMASPSVINYIVEGDSMPPVILEKVASARATAAAKQLDEKTNEARALMEKARADYAAGNASAASSEAETATLLLTWVILDGEHKYRPAIVYTPAYYERALAYEFIGMLSRESGLAYEFIGMRHKARADLEITIGHAEDETLVEKARLKLAELDEK